MGKAAKFKKLRRLANQLPPINIKQVLGERISGKEILDIDKDAKGNAIDSNLQYKRKKIIVVPLNHNKRMKDAYKKYGMKGVEMYGNSVINYVNSKKNENATANT